MTPNIRKRPRPVLVTSGNPVAPPAIGHNRIESLRLQVEYLSLGSLKRPHRETRRRDKKQVVQIAASMSAHGVINPLIVDDDNRIISGVGRFMAAQHLDLAQVPVLRIKHLTKDELRLFALADNKLAELSEWDFGVLKVELIELGELPELELELTGFAGAELDAIILDGASATATVGESEEIEEPRPGAPVSRAGDVFRIGNHMLMCGDARKPETYVTLLNGEKVRMVFADLPYNVRISGNVSGLGRRRHGEFLQGSGEMSRPEFTGFVGDIFGNLVASSFDGAIHFQCMDWRHQVEMMSAGELHYAELKNMLIWSKTNAGMGTFYRSQYELIYAWKVGKGPHVNNFGLGDKGRYRTNVLTYPGCNTFRKNRDEDLEAHSTVKPTALVADLIRDVSNLGDIVLDPCAGSGTTILAAERVKRRARCIELDPKYVDVAIRRAKLRLGLDAIHVETGLTFEALAQVRAEKRGAADASGEEDAA